MPIVAICPYCKKGRVQAPDHALGFSVTCKKCLNSFTIAPADVSSSEAVHPLPARGSRPTASDPTPAPKPIDGLERSSEPPLIIQIREEALDDVPDFDPEPSRDEEIEEQQAESSSKPSDLPARLVLVAACFGGVGLILSQTALGHWGAAIALALGLIIGMIGLAITTRNWPIPIITNAFNAGALLVVLFLPSWLGLGSWRPPAPVENRTIKAFGHDGNIADAPEWIDMSQASWQQGDVRISLKPVIIGSIELTGPRNQKFLTQEKVLQVTIRVRHSGVHGEVGFRGWNAESARLKDGAGRFVAMKKFETGWETPGRAEPKSLGPGMSVESTLVFEVPPQGVRELRLELDGAGYGGTDAVKFFIPPQSLVQR